MRVLLILNKLSSQYTKQNEKRVVDILKAELGTFDMQYFSTEMTIKDNYDRVLVAGGDGSVSFVASKISQQAPLGIVPLGTANLLSKILILPQSIEENIKLLLSSSNKVPLDAMKINRNLYFIQATAGVISNSIQNTTKQQKRLLGELAYTWDGIKRITSNEQFNFQIEIDDIPQNITATEIIIANTGKIIGKEYSLHPSIDPTDASLDVFSLNRITVKKSLLMFQQLLDTQSLQQNLNFIGSGTRIKINSSSNLKLQADGDPVSDLPVTIQVQSYAQEFIVPETTIQS